MRSAPVLFGLLAALGLRAQVRINEVQCTRAPGSDGNGPNGDWVELYNAGDHAVDLTGHVLALNGVAWRLADGLGIGPRGHAVIWCGKAQEPAPDRLAMKLPRHGGTLLLVAPDGSTILDLFSWPALPPGVSMGRATDGAAGRGYFMHPTPGGANAQAVAALLPAPVIAESAGTVSLSSPAAATLRYTLDGTVPDARSAAYAAPLRVPPGTVVMARSFRPDAVPGPCAAFTTGVPDSAWALMMAPADWEGPRGIADVSSGNYARKGRAWQRQAWLQHGGAVLPVGIAIAGSGSRGLPKRNLRLLVRDRFQGRAPVQLPDGSAWKDLLLRADASPGAFLRNRFVNLVAERAGGRVDVQPDFPIALYLNGRDQGLYRAMPAKGKEWVGHLARGLSADIVEGPGAVAVAGSAKRYRRMVKAITQGQPLDSVKLLADVNSLVEMACLDLWTGRADHDLNVRCWRPRTPNGRWRWVLFDMDQWAPADDRTVDRMCSAAAPETPFLPQLLADDGLRDRLLARLSALLATELAPDRAMPLADSLFRQHQLAMAADRGLWAGAMDVPAPVDARAALMEHIAHRGGALLDQLAGRTGLGLRAVEVRVEPPGGGTVLVEELPLTDAARKFTAFATVPLRVKAMPRPGMEFAGWSGVAGTGGEITLAPMRNERITAVFRPAAMSGQGGL